MGGGVVEEAEDADVAACLQLACTVARLDLHPQALASLAVLTATPPRPLCVQLLSPMQQARLAAVAWPWYPYPSKWAPLLLGGQ